MSFIFKIDQPLFFFSIHIHRNNDGAGINLIGFFLILQFSFGFQLFHSQKSQIHQTDELVISSLVKYFTIRQVLLIGLNDRLFIIPVFECYFLQLCGECGMAAVIGPVSIQHTNLCHRRITFFFIFKIVLNMQKIFECHSQIQRVIQFF